MKKFYAMIAIGLALLLFSASALIASSASAEDPNPGAVDPVCLPGWYVNPDELDRKPETSEAGLTFVGNDLVHHTAYIPLADLEPGAFIATPAPSLESFFSVEIINADGTGYATLRHDSTGWFIGGPKTGTYDGHETDPANFIGKMSNWGEIAPDSHVISFGVGYVNTPNDGTETLVTEISFGDRDFNMRCIPPATTTTTTTPPVTETTTTTPPVTTTTTTTPPVTTTTTTPPVTETPSPTATPTPKTTTTPVPVVLTNNLPVTGSSTAPFLAVGILMIMVGASALVIVYRHNRRQPSTAQHRRIN